MRVGFYSTLSGRGGFKTDLPIVERLVDVGLVPAALEEDPRRVPQRVGRHMHLYLGHDLAKQRIIKHEFVQNFERLKGRCQAQGRGKLIDLARVRHSRATSTRAQAELDEGKCRRGLMEGWLETCSMLSCVIDMSDRSAATSMHTLTSGMLKPCPLPSPSRLQSSSLPQATLPIPLHTTSHRSTAPAGGGPAPDTVLFAVKTPPRMATRESPPGKRTSGRASLSVRSTASRVLIARCAR